MFQGDIHRKGLSCKSCLATFLLISWQQPAVVPTSKGNQKNERQTSHIIPQNKPIKKQQQQQEQGTTTSLPLLQKALVVCCLRCMTGYDDAVAWSLSQRKALEAIVKGIRHPKWKKMLFGVYRGNILLSFLGIIWIIWRLYMGIIWDNRDFIGDYTTQFIGII